MKRKLRLCAAYLAVCVMALAVLAGCGSKVPSKKDAVAYVQALLDLMATGDYDHSVKFADVEEGKEAELRDALIDEMLASMVEDKELSEEVVAQIREFLDKAFTKCKYTVGDAVKTGDGEYDVAVTVESLILFEGANEEYKQALSEVVAERYEEISAMSEQELNDLSMTTLLGVLNAHLEDPQYEDPQEVTVHYGLLDEENKIYGVTEEDGNKVGELFFSSAGLE